MSNKKERKTPVEPSVKPLQTLSVKEFRIPYPMVWLCAFIFVLYAGSLNFGFTELDDSIFIKERASYNEQLPNLLRSFKQGVFNETKDTYYRPLLLNSFVLNHAVSGTDIKGYHGFNLLFHLIATLLLFVLFKRLNLVEGKAFLLTAIFAVHPVLSQAVVWIPGRNDTLLAIFAFSFMLAALAYSRNGKLLYLVLQFLFLLAAFFTKESAIFIAPAFFVLCLSLNEFQWKAKRNLALYATWVLSAILWIGIRSMATIQNDPLDIPNLLANLPRRSTIAIQYLGKILLPFNLSVFPMLSETTYVFGFIAIALLAAALYFSANIDWRKVGAGFAWFLILLMPVFLLPASLNEQDFEHRLYLPIVGILWVISQTTLFTNFPLKKTSTIILFVLVLFGAINWSHQQKFTDPLTFWSAAVETTPNSAYANMMMAARLETSDKPKAREVMRNAYRLNPKEKYVNYYIGKTFLNDNQVDSAERYLLAELKTSEYYDSYFLLSRVYFLKKDMNQSISYLEQYMEKDPGLPQAINNYLLMLADTGQFEKARQFIAKKQAAGIPVNSELIDMIKTKSALEQP